MPAGRPTKLTPAVAKKILMHIELGLSYEKAAHLAGVGRSTFHEWKARGEKAKRGKYKDFLDALKEAEIRGEANLLAHIKEHGIKEKPGKWQALAWILERRHPETWSSPAVQIKQEVDLESLSAIADLLKQAGTAESEQGDKKAGSRRDSGPNKRDDAKGKRRK